MAARQNDLRLFLEVLSDPIKVREHCNSNLSLTLNTFKQPPDPNTIMIFLKNFDVTKQALLGIGKCTVLRSAKVSDLFPIINEKMRWPIGTPLKLYEARTLGSALHAITNWLYRKSNPE
jgi:ubiquitin carboxyl-terminal hydrolase 7